MTADECCRAYCACTAEMETKIASQRASIADLKAVAGALERDLVRVESALQSSEFKSATDTCRRALAAKQAECNQLSLLSAEETVKQQSKFEQLDSRSIAQLQQQFQEACRKDIPSLEPHALIQQVRRIIAPVLLSSLTAPQQADLKRVLGDVPLVSSSRTVSRTLAAVATRLEFELEWLISFRFAVHRRNCCRPELSCCASHHAMDTTRWT